MAELVDARDLKSCVERRVGSIPTARIMTKNQRIVALVIETIFIVLNLSVYFTTVDRVQRALTLAITLVLMCFFILDWNALIRKEDDD